MRDLVYYREQGVFGEFIRRIFAVNSDDLWSPSTEEMIDAGVVHAVVSPWNVQETVSLLATLHMINPILCMKNIFPNMYGELDITRHLSIQQMKPIMAVFERMIERSYTTTLGVANVQTIVVDVVISLD